MGRHWRVLSKGRIDLHAKIPIWGAMRKMNWAANSQEWKQRNQARGSHGHLGEIIVMEIIMVMKMDLWATLKLELTACADGLDI